MKPNTLANKIAHLINSGLNNKEIVENLPQSKKYQMGPTRWDLIGVIRQLMTTQPEKEIMKSNKLDEETRQEILGNKLYVVVTTDHSDPERTLFCDVVLITRDKAKAARVEKLLKGYVIGGKNKAALAKLNINVEALSTPIGGWATFTRIIDGSF